MLYLEINNLKKNCTLLNKRICYTLKFVRDYFHMFIGFNKYLRYEIT